MKRYTCIILLILLGCVSKANAQCPGCIVDASCVVSPAAPALCPDTLPSGTAMQYYDEDVTFYMPAQFVDVGTGFNVTLNQIVVTGVVGLPYGLSFESSSSNNIFYPSSNPPLTEHGCAKFCGTPLLAGDYVITVFITAHVTVLGLNQTQDDSFEIPVTILPATGGNNSFTINNPLGCVPLTTSFSANYQSQGNPAYSYVWDFGNGQVSTDENPPAQTYTQPGAYVISLETTIDTLGYFLSSVDISGSPSQCDDIFDGPDYYIKIFEGTTLMYQSSHVTNQSSATFNFPTLSLNNAIYSIEVWDDDVFMGGGATGDDWCTTVSFNGNTAGSHFYNSNGLNISFMIDHPVLNFQESDTVHVYPVPDFGGYVILPDNAVCEGDSITIMTGGNDSWQWYADDLPMAGETDSILVVTQTGLYHVQLMNQYGCITSGTQELLTIVAWPPVPTFWQSGNTLQTMMSGYALQWFLEGNPIPGATQQTYTITQSGMYSLQADAGHGCSVMSDDYYASYTFVEEFHHPEFRNLMIFPNPASDVLSISFEAEKAMILKLDISDLPGRKVYSSQITVTPGSFMESLKVSHLPSGIYLISLKTENGSLVHKLIRE
jgi:hypothetical protein